MLDFGYLRECCAIYDALCRENGWPVPDRRAKRQPPPKPRKTSNAERDQEIRARAAAGEFVPALAREFGLSDARAYQIVRAVRAFTCRTCGQSLDGHRRQFCPTCTTQRKWARQRAWNAKRRAMERASEEAA